MGHSGIPCRLLNVDINELMLHIVSEAQDLACRSPWIRVQRLRIFVLSLINDLQALNPDPLAFVCDAVGLFA